MSEEDVAPYRVSMAPSSIYSRDDEPIRLTTTPPILFQQQPSTAHPAFAIDGPIVKPSRLPLFQQARSKLTRKPSKPVTPSSSTHWDELSGEPSSTGKPSQVKPSTYTVPYANKLRKRSRSPDKKRQPVRDVSPLRIYTDNETELKPTVPLKVGRNSPSVVSPVSPLSAGPSPLSPNICTHLKNTVPVPASIARKPLSKSPAPSENIDPRHTSMVPNSGGQEEQSEALPSHFSWSTYATTAPANRQSVDQNNTNSRFSWSTVATGTTHRDHDREASPPPSPPPPVPANFIEEAAKSRQRPLTLDHPAYRQMKDIETAQQKITRLRAEAYQTAEDESPSPSPPPLPAHMATPTPTPAHLDTPSIMSRRRPVPPDDWTPRSSSLNTPSTLTPRTASPAGAAKPFANSRPITAHSNSSGKKLPMPPTLDSPAVSHTDALLVQQNDLLVQKKNIMKAIIDLERVEKASPMEVSFSTVRDAKRKLEDHRARLAEIEREEHEVGLALVRARRKEEKDEGYEGSGLWVRRVTG